MIGYDRMMIDAPEDDGVFERLCRDVLDAMHSVPNSPTRYGRNGQKQYGVDIWFQTRRGLLAFQCKAVRTFSIADVMQEVRNLEGAPTQPDAYSILVTIAPDARLQDEVLKLSQRRCSDGKCPVDIVFWREIKEWLAQAPEVAARYYPQISGDWSSTALQPALPVADFVGRTIEMGLVRTHFESSGTEVLCIRGMGGAGKSQLARALVQDLAGGFEMCLEVVLSQQQWDGATTTAEALAKLLRVIGAGRGGTAVKLTELAAAWRTATRTRRILLLIDNVTNAEQLRALLPNAQGGSRTLATTRRKFTLPGLASVDLAPLSSAEARDLLVTIAPRAGADEHALAEVVEACAGLPLAVRLAGSFLHVRADWAVDQYARTLRSQGVRLLDQGAADAGELGVRATLMISYDHLVFEMRRRWVAISVLPGRITPTSAGFQWGISSDEAVVILSEFCRVGLLGWEGVVGAYRMHDLARHVAFLLLGEEDRRAEQLRFAERVCDESLRLEACYLEGGDSSYAAVEAFESSTGEVLTAYSYLVEHSGKGDEVDERLCRFIGGIPHLSDLRFSGEQRVEMLSTQCKVAERLGDQRRVGKALGNLGVAYRKLGRKDEATACLRRQEEVATLLDDWDGVAKSLLNRGSVLMDAGDLDGAMFAFGKSFETAIEHKLGETATLAAGGVGRVLLSMGDVVKAKETFVWVLCTAQEVRDLRIEAVALGALGEVFMLEESFGAAADHFRRQFAIASRLRDVEQQMVAKLSLAQVYHQQGDAESALKEIEAAEAASKHALAESWRSKILSVRADILVARHDFSEAESCLREVLSLARTATDRLSEATALANLGHLYLGAKRHRDAYEYSQRACVMCRDLGDRRGEGISAYNAGVALLHLNEIQLAKPWIRRAARLLESLNLPLAGKVHETLAMLGG